MKETVLMYRIEEKAKQAIVTILKQLDVEIREIGEDETPQQIGYLLNLPGFKKSEEESQRKCEESFLFFAFFTDEQLDIVLEIFRRASIPYIPYKAMLTNDNVVYTFEELYTNVEHEYESITNQSKKSN